MLPLDLTTMTMGELPGFSLHLVTTAKIKSFDETFEENMTWLQEVLEDAKKQFGREEIATFPKTPATRRKRQRIRRVSTIHDEETENQPPVRRKSRTSAARRQSRQSIAPLRRSARASVRSTITTQNGRSRLRVSKKVQLCENSVEVMPGFSSSDTGSCSDDGSVSEKAVAKDELPQSTDLGMITTAEAPMVTEEGTNVLALAVNVVNLKMMNANDQSSHASVKRNAVSKTKRGSKKLRLNSGEAVSTVSDNDSSDEIEAVVNKPKSVTEVSSSAPLKRETEQVKETVTRPDSTSTTTSMSGRPKRNTAASKYKDHVKRLISHHEHLIADVIFSSDDEFQSPKSKRVLKETVQKAKQPILVKKGQPKMELEEVVATHDKQGGTSKEKTDNVFVDQSEKKVPELTKEESPKKVQKQPSPKPSPAIQYSLSETVNSDEITSIQGKEVETNFEGPQTSEPTDIRQPQDFVAGDTDDVKMEEEQPSIVEDSLDQRSIAEDSLDRIKTPENNGQRLRGASPNPADMTTDSLDQQNITQDSLDHNELSFDSLNKSTSSAHQTRQSLCKNLSQSIRRSSVAVSRSKKRSSVYQHRTSVRRSVRQSLRSTRASTRASIRRATIEQLLQECSEDDAQDVVIEEVFPEEDAVESPKEEKITTPKSMPLLTHPPAINQETQRITRAASRLAEKQQESPPDKQDTLSNPPKSMESTPDNYARHTSFSSDEDFVVKTPSPECPASKVVRPRGTFLSSGKAEPRPLNNLHGMISLFIRRNTPQKQTPTERQQEAKKNILNKQKRDVEIRRKLEAEKRKQRELQKKKREDRIKKVSEARERRAAIQEQKRLEMYQKQQDITRQTTRKIEDKKQEEIMRKQMQTKKAAEAEERRRQEEEARLIKMQEQEEEQRQHLEMIQRKKEFEEQERQRRIDDARRQQEQRRAEIERQRQEELLRRREVELAKERELQLLKEEREREKKAELERKREQERRAREEALEKERRMEVERLAQEKERQQKHFAELLQKEREFREKEREFRERQEQAEHERLKASILKHNPSACQNTSSPRLNTTTTKEGSPMSYDMTPRRLPLPSTSENYNIDDLDSGDSSDDEDAPRKTVPSWAEGPSLKGKLIEQYYHPPHNLETMFGPLQPPDLTIIFAKKKLRYLKRTSSAVWDSPLLKRE